MTVIVPSEGHPAGAAPEPSSAPLPPARGEGGFRVLIAGGGVAALEAVLTFAEIDLPGLKIELVCPEREFTLRPLSVALPFGAPPPRKLDLAGFCADHGVTLRQDRVGEVWGDRQRVLLDSGEDVFYDALLLAFGAKPYEALPGALTFRGAQDASAFSELLDRVEAGEIARLAFAVPAAIRWSLPIYELALMTAHRLAQAHASVKLALVTQESEPLFPFSGAAAERLTKLLEDAGVSFQGGHAPARFEDSSLLLDDGTSVAADAVVALPGLRLPPVPGLPGGARGFIATDAEMRVDGLAHAWAVGDATWFPIKQGGLAAQQAEVAAASVAALAGATGEVPAFAPVIRSALLTGQGVEYMRSDMRAGASAEVAESPLWWPPGKVASKRLAPYLARVWGGDPADPLQPLEDLSAPTHAGREAAAEDHRESVELALTCARVDADAGDLGQALRWLDVAEKLDITLSAEYASRRRDWERRLREGE